ncbi:hypothetical protein [Melghirimyces algeriensis]|uniref:Uncharacterized protein n=1 Tax=Melghirimyces algeriensis TaxID=910412 RepID=A0A521AK39_9BACL|nr:hypothetical protein [Melghirimyces algeriensis]SMO35163.1 hypothetical protein SAMN06264849_101190 [Melghirimyces algeriensis]
MKCCCIKKKKRRKKVHVKLKKEKFKAAAKTVNKAKVRNTAGLVNVIVQVPIQIGSDSNNMVGSDDNAVSQGV